MTTTTTFKGMDPNGRSSSRETAAEEAGVSGKPRLSSAEPDQHAFASNKGGIYSSPLNLIAGLGTVKVLRPPGGGSNFSLGFDEPKEQPVRRNKMASNIFGTPEENPPSWARSTAAKSSDISESSEAPGSQRRKSTDANCGDYIDPKGGEVEVPENTDAEIETASGLSEEKPLPAAPLPSPVAPAPSRRNPPGGKSSLVLG